jgi:hypothetical protein
VTGDEFEDFDGAFVLGALSVEERAAFEDHLLGCAACRERVAELADLPDLLALVPASAFEAGPATLSDPVVPLLAAVRARRRQRRWIAVAAASVAAACLVLATVLIVGLTRKDTPATPLANPVTMTALVSTPIHASADVKQLKWGTSIHLLCTYDEEPSYPAGAYTLTVQSREGVSNDLGTWNVLPGKTMSFVAGTSLALSDIKTITIATTSGMPLLQLAY